MNIVKELHEEEARLQQQLKRIHEAIAALNGAPRPIVTGGSGAAKSGKRTLSAAGRARISRAAKARWAKIKAEQSKKAK